MVITMKQKMFPKRKARKGKQKTGMILLKKKRQLLPKKMHLLSHLLMPG